MRGEEKMQPTFKQGFIDIKDATQNNLQHVNLRVPKYQTTGYRGPASPHWCSIRLRRPHGGN